jgi:hypothetical protein
MLCDDVSTTLETNLHKNICLIFNIHRMVIRGRKLYDVKVSRGGLDFINMLVNVFAVVISPPYH